MDWKTTPIIPPGLNYFGIPAHQIIFINLVKPKDILWATEEALKCQSLNGVISELEAITFAQSQRLQLTVEKAKSQVLFCAPKQGLSMPLPALPGGRLAQRQALT